jgi:hypothetical protein
MRQIKVGGLGATLAVVPVLLLLNACASEPPVAEVRDTFKPVVSLNQVMVGVVDHNAHLLWNAATDEYAPQNDADWHELEHAAITLAATGNVILLGGSGPDDLAWAEKPDWAALTQRETDAALAIMLAVQNKDRDALSKGGDSLVEACESCHAQHKPDLPSIVATPEEQPEHFYGAPRPAAK